jgi:dihydrofolate reductase
MRISLIVAMSENRVIGREGVLPWRLSADLRRFKRLTMGHTIVMGRKTFESIGRLLPGRTSIVVTRQANYDGRGALVARDLDEAIGLVADGDEAFIIGGAEIYRQALPRVERIYLTLVHANVEGDTFFPELQQDQWHLVETERHAADEKNEYDYNFQVLDRI